MGEGLIFQPVEIVDNVDCANNKTNLQHTFQQHENQRYSVNYDFSTFFTITIDKATK